jgi:galactokinase
MSRILPWQAGEVAVRLRREFATRYGSADGVRLFFAPGRVNLIGAHLDYNGGTVLPVAGDRGVFVLARPRTDRRVRMASLNQPQTSESVIGPQEREPAGHWANYPRGVLHLFPVGRGLHLGVDLLFEGTIPMGSGLSSSAAIEVVTGLALDRLFGAGLSLLEIARLAHEAETGFVGVRCGIMDQFASALSEPGHALLLRCRKQEYHHVPLPSDRLEIVMLDTRKPRSLVQSEFNLRVEQCWRAFEKLSRRVAGRDCLAEFMPADLERHGGELSEDERKRARHVVEEQARVIEAEAALARGDLVALGQLVSRSHRSSRDLYGVSCAELDFLVEAAEGTPGAFGARLTGAGFGGCVMAIAEPGTHARLEETIVPGFSRRFGVRPILSVLRPGGGPSEIPDG